jgi:AraC family transcriptional regulator
MRSHTHEPAYLSLVLKGAYTETCAKRSCTRSASTIIFHPPDEPHAVDFHNTEVRIFRIEIKSRWLEQARKSVGLPEYSTDFHGGLIGLLFNRLYGEFQQTDASSGLAIEGLMLEIIAEISRHQTRNANQKSPRWLEQARAILRERISDPPSFQALAKTVGVHPVYLAREFRRRYHCTLGEYLRQLRIERACSEISRSHAPLCEIAAVAGFYDQSHFSNSFKRYTGMTPAEYRGVLRSGAPHTKRFRTIQDVINRRGL